MRVHVVACLALGLVLLVSLTAIAAQPAPTWVQTQRETALWSAPSDPADQFTTVPSGSFAFLQATELRGHNR